jgi:hypothetical protein
MGEEDGTFEAMALGENAGEHRQGFFGAIFFVADKEHDVFASARAFARRELEPTGAGSKGLRSDGRESKDKGGQGGPEMEMTLHGVRHGRLHRR